MARTRPRAVPAWDDYFMMLALVAAMRSKDPNTQIGALIIDKAHKVVSTGYNGTADTVDDNAVDWSRPQKYAFMLHAENNAIDQYLAARGRQDGMVLYVTGPPCHVCTNRAAANGVRRIVYGPQQIQMVDDAEWEQARENARIAKVELARYSGNLGVFLDQVELLKARSPEFFRPQGPLPL